MTDLKLRKVGSVLSLYCFSFSGGATDLSAPNESQESVILFEENFNDLEPGEFGLQILGSAQVELVEGGGPDGSDAIRVSYEGFEAGSRRVGGKYPLRKRVKEATLSFDVYFEDGFQWTLGGKLHGVGPERPVSGGRPRRAERWSSRIMFKEDGRVATYLYDQNQSKRWGVGKKTVEPVFKIGEWQRVSVQTRLNDPGEKNGFVRVLIDGKEVVSSENISFRGIDTQDTMIQQFLFSTFHGGSDAAWTPVDASGNPTVVHARFDNFRVIEGGSEVE